MTNPRMQCSERIPALLVDGSFLLSHGTSTVSVINPSTGCPIFDIAAGSEIDADCAVASARRAFDDGRWSEASPSSRKRTLNRFAELIAANARELDAIDAEEMGKPIAQLLFNAAAAADLMRFHAEAIDKVLGDVFTSDKNSFVVQRRVPRGVVAAVVPWNFPTFNAVLKVAPALAAGNCVVLKPSELASRSALRLGELGLEAGLPPGVLNVVLGLGENVGRALALHRDIDLIAFTGSTEVGKLMLQYAGQSNMKPVLAECGGKSPQIVFADGVDLDSACESIASALLSNQGQICSVGSRLLVERSIEEKVVEKITSRLRQIVIGDALDERTTFGPLASASQCERVMQYIREAHRDDARIVTGGQRVLRETGGYFVEPTVFSGVAPSARIAQEEIFGPVLSIIPFENEQAAIRIANDTVYGLAAYVWTADLSRGIRMAKAIRSTVMINAVAPLGEGPGHAFSAEPMRQSGVGPEGGLAGIESYMRRQTVWINHV